MKSKFVFCAIGFGGLLILSLVLTPKKGVNTGSQIQSFASNSQTSEPPLSCNAAAKDLMSKFKKGENHVGARFIADKLIRCLDTEYTTQAVSQALLDSASEAKTVSSTQLGVIRFKQAKIKSQLEWEYKNGVGEASKKVQQDLLQQLLVLLRAEGVLASGQSIEMKDPQPDYVIEIMNTKIQVNRNGE